MIALRPCHLLAILVATGCASTATTAPSTVVTDRQTIVAAAPAVAPIATPSKNGEVPAPLQGQRGLLQLRDVFELEWASSPRIAPDARHIVYLRRGMDIMSDRRTSELWILGADGRGHRPLVADKSAATPRWSPSGDRIAFVSASDSGAQIFVHWLDTGATAPVTRLTESPSNLEWSPDGRTLAFTMRVPAKAKPMVQMPAAPEGATWATPPTVIDKLTYRVDGAGYLEAGYTHLFVVPADGGTPRQLTAGDFNHPGRPAWSPDGTSLFISANRAPDWEYQAYGEEVFEVDVATGQLTQRTRRDGPDQAPLVSPDGGLVAYLGFDDKRLGNQNLRLYVMNRDGSGVRPLTDDLDRSIERFEWTRNGRSLVVQYSDEGNTKLASVDVRTGKRRVLTGDVGGESIGRPYGGGSFSIADNGVIAFTMTRPDHPADVALLKSGDPVRLTRLNDDLFAGKTLGSVEEVWTESSHDGQRVHGWLVKPPGFDANQKYPLVLEIHGGPFANYGDRFSLECQLYAAAGYAVLYTNPRGSTSYGEKFANLIHHNYPGNDYDDLMSLVDAAIAGGSIDEDRLFVTGGSGGGVLTSWIVGKTRRFRAAVVAKPVINWESFVLTADFSAFFVDYWFPGPPWEHADHYRQRSPLSLVGNVETPTMLLTGEADYRTPMSESEQYYQALKLRKVDTALVRIPGAGHSIASRPSQLMAKVAHVLAWFATH